MSDERPTEKDAEQVFKSVPAVARAPWDEAQIKSLNDYQEARVFHPYTHSRDEDGNDEILVATKDGWKCPNHPDHLQDWAWDWTANDQWRTIFEIKKWDMP